MKTQHGAPLQAASTPERSFAEALPQIIWTARPDGTFDWVNGAFRRVTGVSDSELADGSWRVALHADDRDKVLAAWHAAIGRGKPFRTEFRLWSLPQACWRRHLVDARPQEDASGQIQRWYGSAIDIEDLRDAEDAREAELRLQIVERHVLEGIAAGAPLNPLLKDICVAVSDVLQGARAIVVLVSEDGKYLDTMSGDTMLEGWYRDIAPLRVAEGQLTCGTAVFRRKPVFTTDTRQDPLWSGQFQAAASQGLAACWALPVMDASGTPIACLACFHASPCAPTNAQVALLHRLGKTVRTAISEVASRDQLHASERRYHSLFDFLPIAIWENDITAITMMLAELKQTPVIALEPWLDANPEFVDQAAMGITVLDANRAARQLYGVDADGPDGMTRALRAQMLEPTYRATLRGLLLALWDRRPDFEAGYTVTRADGGRAEVLVRMQLPAPGSGRLLVAELDITSQRRAEERFRHVAHASSDYIFDRDLTTEKTWVNDAASWLRDMTPGACEVPRQTWVDSVHPDDSVAILAGIAEAISGDGTSWEAEYRLRLSDGSYIPVLERASILRDDFGQAVRLIGNIINLSEQKELEAQLRQSQRLDAIGQLTGGIAHDFNNLLTVILGNAEALNETLPAGTDIATMAQQIMLASERAAELTQRLLAFARKQPLLPGIFDPNMIIENMRLLIGRSITPAIALELELARKLGSVQVDRAMFESAILNLCVNARDAMPEGGTLRITTSAALFDPDDGENGTQAREYIKIMVSDTGHGMNEKTRTRVFEPFFTTKPPGQGSGLGLSMVHGFVHQSGGRVRVHSSESAGTAVELLLPVHDGPERAEPGNIEPAATMRGPSPRARILLVEDEEQVRDYICMILRSLGYAVVAESSATPALGRLRAGERFDLLLSDIVMPGEINGRQLAELVLVEHADLPVLLVSGHADDISTPDGQLDQRIGFLRKPFRKSDLAQRLAEMLPT